MRKLTILLLTALVVSCANNNKTAEHETAVAETPTEIYAIDSIKFSTSEMEFSEMSNTFQSSHRNPSWSVDNLDEYAYVFNGFGYDNIKGIFTPKDGSLVGVALRGTDHSENDTDFYENFERLEAYLKTEFGNPTDVHSNLTMRDIEEKGEIPVSLWAHGKKSYLTTISYDGEHYTVNLFVYRNDKLQPDTTLRAIDGELAALRKLM